VLPDEISGRTPLCYQVNFLDYYGARYYSNHARTTFTTIQHEPHCQKITVTARVTTNYETVTSEGCAQFPDKISGERFYFQSIYSGLLAGLLGTTAIVQRGIITPQYNISH
jgi:hypothetical protein